MYLTWYLIRSACFCSRFHLSGNAAVVVEESSSGGGSSSAFAADGDLTTLWEASTNTNEWVTLDLGDVREVTTLRLQVQKLFATAVKTLIFYRRHFTASLSRLKRK